MKRNSTCSHPSSKDPYELKIKMINSDVRDYKVCRSCEQDIKSRCVPEFTRNIWCVLFCFEWKRPSSRDLETFLPKDIANIITNYYFSSIDFKVLPKIDYNSWSLLLKWINRANRCGAIILDSSVLYYLDDARQCKYDYLSDDLCSLIFDEYGSYDVNVNVYDEYKDQGNKKLMKVLWKGLAPIRNDSSMNLSSTEIFLKRFIKYLQERFMLECDNNTFVWFEIPRTMTGKTLH